MMSSKLLREGDSHIGFSGWVNRRFEVSAARYVRILTNTLKWRPVTLTFALLFALLVVPFYMISMKDLAPKEDQGVVLGIVQAAPNATIEQTSRFTEKVNDVFKSMPETAQTFQITDPTFGFSGMVTKPWSERTRSTEEIVGEVFGKVSAIPGVRVIATTPEPLPGGSQFPIDFVINSTAEPREIYDFANQIVQKALDSKLFMFVDTDMKYDQPQTEIVFDRDQVAIARRQSFSSRRGPRYVAWRQLCQPVQ